MAKSKSLNARSGVLKQSFPVSMVESMRAKDVARRAAGRPQETRNNMPESISAVRQSEPKRLSKRDEPLLVGYERLPDEPKAGNGDGYGVSYDGDNAKDKVTKPVSGVPGSAPYQATGAPKKPYESKPNRNRHGKAFFKQGA